MGSEGMTDAVSFCFPLPDFGLPTQEAVETYHVRPGSGRE